MIRDDIWLGETIERLTPLISQVYGAQHGDKKWSIRLALLHSSRTLITSCSVALRSVIPPLVRL
jgi:hypothetical protein